MDQTNEGTNNITATGAPESTDPRAAGRAGEILDSTRSSLLAMGAAYKEALLTTRQGSEPVAFARFGTMLATGNLDALRAVVAAIGGNPLPLWEALFKGSMPAPAWTAKHPEPPFEHEECWSHAEHEDDERWLGAHATREEAIAEGRDAYEGAPFYVLRGVYPDPASFLPGAQAIVEQMAESAAESGVSEDDVDEDFPHIDQAAADELDALMDAGVPERIEATPEWLAAEAAAAAERTGEPVSAAKKSKAASAKTPPPPRAAIPAEDYATEAAWEADDLEKVATQLLAGMLASPVFVDRADVEHVGTGDPLVSPPLAKRAWRLAEELRAHKETWLARRRAAAASENTPNRLDDDAIGRELIAREEAAS